MENEFKNDFYEFESFRLNPTRRMLFRENGEQVHLTPKAFELLLVFVENRGRLLKKDELIEKIWGDSFVEEGNLSQTISVLRKTLGEKRKEHRFIVTEPRQGYRFVAKIVKNFESELSENEVLEYQNENETAAISKFSEPYPLSDTIIKSVKNSDSARFFHKPLIFFIIFAVLLTAGFTALFLYQTGNDLIFFITFAVLLAIGFTALFLFQIGNNSKRAANIKEIKTIAVLPFRTIGTDESTNHLGLGMTDTLVFKLSNLKNIIVRQTNAVSRYTESASDPADIGRELKVEAVLDGSVQKDVERIRVNVRLIRVNDNTTLWTDAFVDKFTNIFTVQDTISKRVVDSLELQITGEEEKLIEKRYTEDIEAYQIYQRGRFFWNKRTHEDFLKAIELFEQAIKRDLNYALPYTGLADSYHLLGDYSYLAPQNSILKAKESALKALERDNSLSEAHTSLAYAKFLYDWDWTGAESSFKRALELNPNYATAHQWHGEYLAAMGCTDEALKEIEHARNLDPQSPTLSAAAGWMYYIARDYDRAIRQEQNALEMDANLYPAHFWIGQAAEKKGDLNQAIDKYKTALELSPDNSEVLASLGHAFAAAGQKDKAQQILVQLSKLSEQSYVSPYLKSLVYAGLGENDQAIKWLEKSSAERSRAMPFLKVDPMMENLQTDPRFQELLRRMQF